MGTFVFAVVLSKYLTDGIFGLLLGGNTGHNAHKLREVDAPSLLLVVLGDYIVHDLFVRVEAEFLQGKSEIAGVQDALPSRVDLVEDLLYHNHVLLVDALRNIQTWVELGNE